MTIVKAKERKQVKRVFHDLNTLSQVWNNEPQHFQMVFSFWELKFYEIFNYKNASNRVGPNWVFNISLERFWNVNIKSELTFFIWNCVLEKIVSLIPNL
jgi:hypothetical protein